MESVFVWSSVVFTFTLWLQLVESHPFPPLLLSPSSHFPFFFLPPSPHPSFLLSFIPPSFTFFIFLSLWIFLFFLLLKTYFHLWHSILSPSIQCKSSSTGQGQLAGRAEWLSGSRDSHSSAENPGRCRGDAVLHFHCFLVLPQRSPHMKYGDRNDRRVGRARAQRKLHAIFLVFLEKVMKPL